MPVEAVNVHRINETGKLYKVAAKDLEWLGERVQKLKELTEEICKEKIEGFKK